jgi:hypothetical protein
VEFACIQCSRYAVDDAQEVSVLRGSQVVRSFEAFQTVLGHLASVLEYTGVSNSPY